MLYVKVCLLKKLLLLQRCDVVMVEHDLRICGVPRLPFLETGPNSALGLRNQPHCRVTAVEKRKVTTVTGHSQDDMMITNKCSTHWAPTERDNSV